MRNIIILAAFIAMSCVRNADDISIINTWKPDLLWNISASDTAITVRTSRLENLFTLLQNDVLIPYPFFADNEKSLQWIADQTWVYETQFDADSISFYSNQEIVFEQIDTYANVYLNDSLLFVSNNMFHDWRTSVVGILKLKDNHLKIVFPPIQSYIDSASKTLNYRLPDERAWIRKPPYQSGWDWGPRFISVGINESFYFNFWNDAKVFSPYIYTSKIEQDKAELNVSLNVCEREVSVYQLFIIDEISADTLFSKHYRISSDTLLNGQFTMKNPQLWWCNGMGEPNLYQLRWDVYRENRLLFSQKQNLGIRTIQLIQNQDSTGRTFYFELNGEPVFAKGANLIPDDHFNPFQNRSKMDSLLNMAINSNMNMLRVWGGGVYPEDEFYSLCDSKGLMIWQDFMFAGAMYPPTEAFEKGVSKEVEYQVKRLRNHPSLALWCGNNEVSNAWHDWGWKKQYSEHDANQLWQANAHLFEEKIPDIVEQFQKDVSYYPSSPLWGWGHPENLLEGDAHYWGVWWGEEPFIAYANNVGRFMSEYGFQALPDLKTIKAFAPDSDLTIGSSSILWHQKHARGFETIDKYLSEFFPKPKNLKEYIYLSQLTQAYGIKTAIDAHRVNRPNCMGSLYWQFNDSWPVTSWSSVDYFLRPKALYYYAGRAFKNERIAVVPQNSKIAVYFLQDQKLNRHLTFKAMHLTTNGLPLDSVIISSNEYSKFVNLISTINLQKNAESISDVWDMQIWENNRMLDRTLFLDGQPKMWELKKAKIEMQIVSEQRGVYQLIFKSDKLVKDLYISSSVEGLFSNNFFDLMPNESVSITFEDKNKALPNFEWQCLNDVLNKN
ncbi:MAG: glycoside hydrolase family 2 protein [Bacteroidales bacterium]|nr:glycoside hydrolase family 2 protein [Bacteroidales bacterium]